MWKCFRNTPLFQQFKVCLSGQVDILVYIQQGEYFDEKMMKTLWAGGFERGLVFIGFYCGIRYPSQETEVSHGHHHFILWIPTFLRSKQLPIWSSRSAPTPLPKLSSAKLMSSSTCLQQLLNYAPSAPYVRNQVAAYQSKYNHRRRRHWGLQCKEFLRYWDLRGQQSRRIDGGMQIQSRNWAETGFGMCVINHLSFQAGKVRDLIKTEPQDSQVRPM